MNTQTLLIPADQDQREIDRRNELLKKITEGDPFAPGELQFRRVLGQRGLTYDQIQQSILNAFMI